MTQFFNKIKQNWVKAVISGLVVLNVFLFIQNKDALSPNTAMVGDINRETPDIFDYRRFVKVLLPDGSTGTEPICDNYKEIQSFEKPISVVWTAKLSGCIVSCDGAAFRWIRNSTQTELADKYTGFIGYYYQVDLQKLQDNKHAGKVDTLKIYGDWHGIDADHPVGFFNNLCVPIVEIKKIEIVN